MRKREIVSFVVTAAAGVLLSVAQHTFAWSHRATLLVGLAVVAVLVVVLVPWMLIGAARP